MIFHQCDYVIMPSSFSLSHSLEETALELGYVDIMLIVNIAAYVDIAVSFAILHIRGGLSCMPACPWHSDFVSGTPTLPAACPHGIQEFREIQIFNSTDNDTNLD